MNILKAAINDLPAILALQRLAYQSEALLHDDFTIPPLTQTLEGITADFHKGVILKAVAPDDEIIGSIRGYLAENTLHIGKLIVHPSFQDQGIGTALLLDMESLHPGVRYELFTSDKSLKNLYLYQKHGYIEFKRGPLNVNSELIFLEKCN